VDIATASSRVRILVVPTNEELEIATQTLEAIG
jgi:acetate kinase